MTINRRTFSKALVATVGVSAWHLSRPGGSASAQTSAGGEFVMDFSGLCLYERWQKTQRVRVLLAQGGDHHATLIANLKDVLTAPSTEAILVTPDGQELGVWDIGEVACTFPKKGGENGLQMPSINAVGECPKSRDTASQWNSFHWLADIGKLCGSDKIKSKPPINGEFTFERGEVQCVMPASQAARRALYGYCGTGLPPSQAFVNKVRFIQPMPTGTFNLELRPGDENAKFALKTPPGASRIAVSICNFPKAIKIGPTTGHIGTSHFALFYELIEGPKGRPLLTYDRDCGQDAKLIRVECGKRTPRDPDHCPGGQVVHPE